MWTVRLSSISAVRDKRAIALTYDEMAAPLAAGYRSRSLGNRGIAVGIGPGACYCSGAFAIGRDGSATDRDAVRTIGAGRIGSPISIVSLDRLSMHGADDFPHDIRLTNGNLTRRRCGSERDRVRGVWPPTIPPYMPVAHASDNRPCLRFP
jgi:hypothetical protein